MANFSKVFVTLLAVCLLAMGLFLPTEAANVASLMNENNLFMARPVCGGSMAECLEGDALDELEFGLDSESNRRVLATVRSFLSNEALNKNRVSCSIRGAPYGNCRPGAQANPHTRGCGPHSRCRRG